LGRKFIIYIMAKEKQTARSKESSVSPDTRGKQLVVVESPAKARTINKYLGPEYLVMASVGHVRDLPGKNPKGVKDPVPGVDLDHDFRPTYQIIKGKSATIKQLKKAAQDASGIWLATDLDREGEAIAWHLTEALDINAGNINRVVFNAITRQEIERAFKNPRLIDMNKVNAQQARRILDRIVGYQVSPLLWKKVSGGLSAGRVQSVAVRLLVEREREIRAFKPEEYWRLIGYFTTSLKNAPSLAGQWREWLEQGADGGDKKRSNGRTSNERSQWLFEHEGLAAELIKFDDRKFRPADVSESLEIAMFAGFRLDSKTEDDSSGTGGKEAGIVTLKGHLEGGPEWNVKSIQTRRANNRPQAPFITSTLQQAAANQLGFTTQVTMRIAQALYEGVAIDKMGSVGLITYMRTDSTHISPDAISMARDYIQTRFGDKYLPPKANYFSSSNKSAQEAHEAVRPTDVDLTPESVRSSLTNQQYRLYKIIWERFIASQMKDAVWDNTIIMISGLASGKELLFRATGRVLIFDGYYKVTGVPNNSEEAVLPPLKEGQSLAAIHMDPVQNFTSPPPRYTEASLVKKLEAEGIGRPSTYAQIIQVIQARKYTQKIKNRFYATDLGEVVTDKLVEAFPEILHVGYTRDMEQQLDDIEEKQADWVQMLRRFYGPFKKNLEAAYQVMGHAKAEVQPAPHICPQCGSATVYRFGRKGRFLSCSTYPDCKYASPIDRDGNPVVQEQTDIACPRCGGPMLLRKGRFGPFLSCLRYPDCDGILNLDRRGFIGLPKVPPLLTDLRCPKCDARLNIRRGARGPWLSCSKFPKCRGRMGWTSLDNETKNRWEKALGDHEKSHPQAVIKTLAGEPIGDEYIPKTKSPINDVDNGID
jgi:DNA topoisomerase-1